MQCVCVEINITTRCKFLFQHYNNVIVFDANSVKLRIFDKILIFNRCIKKKYIYKRFWVYLFLVKKSFILHSVEKSKYFGNLVAENRALCKIISPFPFRPTSLSLSLSSPLYHKINCQSLDAI